MSNASPTHRKAIFLLILPNHTILHRRPLKAHEHTTAHPQPILTAITESCIRAIPFLFCGVEQWITLLHLFSSLHFPKASRFPGAIEALKRRLAFRWQNIEKVTAVRHNAAIHGAHQLLKCHSFFPMTKATEHNGKQTSIITYFQELAGFDFLDKSWGRKAHKILSNVASWASNTHHWLLCFTSH